MNVLELGEQIASGAEHQVYRLGSGEVAKIPAPWASVWQKMTPDLAERDLAMLQDYGVETVPTGVVKAPRVRLPNGQEQEAPYALIQAFLQAEPVRVADLADPVVGQVVATLFERSQEMYRHEGLGVDFVGFATLSGLIRSFFRGKVDVAIHNVLTTGGQNPEVRLCDTRLYDREAFRWWMRSTLYAALHLQHETVGLALEGRGYSIARASTAALPRVVGQGLYALIENRL